MFSKQCKAHLEEKGETALEHMGIALKTAARLQLLVPALIIHSVAPRCFTNTTTEVLKDILDNRKQYEVGIVGFTHIGSSWVGTILFVKGRTCYDIMLPYPVCCMVMMLWKHTNARRLQKLKNKYKRT